jgi:kynureninase
MAGGMPLRTGCIPDQIIRLKLAVPGELTEPVRRKRADFAAVQKTIPSACHELSLNEAALIVLSHVSKRARQTLHIRRTLTFVHQMLI